MAAEGMDLIVTSGGLGPTADDLTAEIVARFAGRELVLDEEMEEKIAEILRGFARRFSFDEEAVREAPTASRRWCRRGRSRSTRSGPRPGWSCPADGRVVVVLPGPPRELQPMWPAALATAPVREVLDAGDAAARLHAADVRRPRVRDRQEPARDRGATGSSLGAVEITTCLRRGEIEIDVRYRDEAAADAEAVRAGLAERHERHLFSLDGETIDSQVAAAAGGAAARAGRVVQRRPAGGADHRPVRAPPPTWPAASSPTRTRRRRSCSGVDPALIEAHGAVSPEVAEAMAIGALERFGADVAVSITGIAGPDGGTEEKPVGYVCFNARLADGTAIAREPVIPGGRDDIRERSALVGMHLLRILLERRRGAAVASERARFLDDLRVVSCVAAA